FEVLGKRFAFGPVSLDPRPERNPQSMRNGVDGLDDVAHPGPHSLHFVYHWAERNSYIETAASAAHFLRQFAAALRHARAADKRTRIISIALFDPQPANRLPWREE